ncbi:MAG: hypothetical protein ACYC4L_07440 [Chloroflexota bacterium]
MRRYWALGTLLIVGLLAGAFYWLDFWAAQSETQTSSQVTTISNGQAQQMYKTRLASNAPTLTVFVHGDEAVAKALGPELRRQLGQSPLFAQVVFEPQAGETASGDVLLVDLSEYDTTWTGVYAKAVLLAKVAYSTTGDVTWRHSKTTSMSSEKPGLMLSGVYTMADSSRGLLSRQGYASHLGRQMAADIARSFLAELQRQTT